MTRLLASTISLSALFLLTTAKADDAVDSAPQTSMLVLMNGRVVTGQLTPRVGGYEVTQPGGSLFLPSDSIRLFATDIDDAYDKMRASLPQLTPNDHIDLARWCLTNRLHAKAQRELLDALHMDPYRDDAKRMLQALRRTLSSESSGGNLTAAGTSDPGFSPEADTRPSRSLGGLSRPLARDFVSRVQPLMANKCGNATCHGGGVERPFVIHPLRNTSSPHQAEQNLAAVLNQINFESPPDSPLLKDLDGLHGGLRQPLFRGRHGAVQISQLQEWVHAAAEEISPASASMTAAASARHAGEAADTDPAIQQTAFQFPDDSGNGNTPFSATADFRESVDDGDLVPAHGVAADPHGRFRSIAESDSQFLLEAENANRSDAFDPNIFNRRFHADRFESTTRSRKDSR
ncbi:MAG: hypothetical protein R3C19_00330 [Planctomycetaceae bacterium]